MSEHTAEDDAPAEPMHRWVEPHGDLTACGIRWWNGTRGEESVTCPACVIPPAPRKCRCEGCWWPMRLIVRLPEPLYRLACRVIPSGSTPTQAG